MLSVSVITESTDLRSVDKRLCIFLRLCLIFLRNPNSLHCYWNFKQPAKLHTSTKGEMSSISKKEGGEKNPQCFPCYFSDLCFPYRPVSIFSFPSSITCCAPKWKRDQKKSVYTSGLVKHGLMDLILTCRRSEFNLLTSYKRWWGRLPAAEQRWVFCRAVMRKCSVSVWVMGL